MLTYFGYLFLFIFIMFMIQMINEGPFILHSGNKHFVNISDLKFDIDRLNITKGDTVVWTNYDQIRHTITNDSPKINNSEILYQYDKFTYIFHQEGEFTFYSSLYDNMETMTVFVKKSLKGRNFYGEIGGNLVTMVKEFFGSILFYVIYGIKQL